MFREKLQDYVRKFMFRFAVEEYTTKLMRLEKGIAMSCAVSSVLFIMVMEVFIKGCGNKNQLKAFIDGLTVLEIYGGKRRSCWLG